MKSQLAAGKRGQAMERVRELLEYFGVYAVPILFVLLELAAAVILLNLYLNIKRKKRDKTETWQRERLYYESISQGKREVQILLRHSDLCPLFVTGNFERLLHVNRDAFQVDVTLLAEAAVRRDALDFWEAYQSWDQESPLEKEFKLQGKEQWMRLEVTSCVGGEHDLWVFQDITKEKKALQALEDKLQEAEDASQSKTSFLSKMSHEIRTPMNGIIGMLALAKTQMHADCQIRQYVEKAENLSQYLLSLINDILDMSRIEAGKIELEAKKFDIHVLAEKLRNMFQKNVEAKGLRFEIEMLDFDVRWLIGDELRISQVLVNFLSNAVKFTEKGEIRVTFRQMMKDGGRINLMMRVHDTGIGMDPEFIYHIFRPFEQENVGITKRYGGSGLGMAITDQLVRLMGGEIVVDSMPGVGSDFTVYLNLPFSDPDGIPDSPAAAGALDNDGTFTFENLRILMAEDNEINAEIAVEILTMAGAKVEVAGNGQKAVDRFAASPAGYYDLILMDIQMPVLNGYEATGKIRGMERADAGRIPIFALSADAFVEDKRHAAQVGMNGHFAKPIDFEEVRVTVGRFLKEREH